MPTLNEIFDIEYGNKGYSNKSVLDDGETLLIASQGVDNGAYGFFDIPVGYNAPIITVPRTGSIGYAFVQLTNCTITDDCMVLKPKKQLSKEYLFYIASMIRLVRWRYNYARKITPERLGKLKVINPEEFETSINHDGLTNELIPEKQEVREIEYHPTKKEFLLSELFDIVSGDYHNASELPNGKIPLVSCGENDNGIIKFVDVPENKIYEGLLTTAYNGQPLTTKYHPYKFAAKDDVAVLIPKQKYAVSTILFINILLNLQTWRYSYGRKCFNQKIQKLVLKLPTKDGEIDEDYIEKIMKDRDIFDYIQNT